MSDIVGVKKVAGGLGESGPVLQYTGGGTRGYAACAASAGMDFHRILEWLRLSRRFSRFPDAVPSQAVNKKLTNGAVFLIYNAHEM
jgi:hypothetical protein